MKKQTKRNLAIKKAKKRERLQQISQNSNYLSAEEARLIPQNPTSVKVCDIVVNHYICKIYIFRHRDEWKLYVEQQMDRMSGGFSCCSIPDEYNNGKYLYGKDIKTILKDYIKKNDPCDKLLADDKKFWYDGENHATEEV